ncbi:MAG: hypothetical protein ACLGI2_04425 [Acidimicrobiia bacterium]
MRITAARARVGLSVGLALFALHGCQSAAGAGGGDPGRDAFDVLLDKAGASHVHVAAPSRSGFEVLVAKVAAGKVRPAAAGTRRALVPSAPAAAVAAGSVNTLPGGPPDGSAFTAAHGFPEWEPPPTTAAPTLVVPTKPSEWFNPRGRHEGTEGIVADLARLGVTDNGRLYVNECWGRTWGASTSDHHRSQARSWACDLSVPGVQVPTPEAQKAAERIGSALGVPGWTGGNLRTVVDGYRIQVLWKVAGHFDHVHIGVRKV